MKICFPFTLVLFASALSPAAWGQTVAGGIDSEHSTASLTVSSASGGSAWNVGIAKVSGMVRWNETDPTKSAFDFTIYPAHERARLLNSDGSVRSYTAANLARYTVMTFRSDHVQVDQAGKLEVHGELTITHVTREVNTPWSNAYTGAEYGPPVLHTATGEVVFTLENFSSVARLGQANEVISGSASVGRKDFSGLQAALVDAVWPVVVEDEHCEMPAPKPSLRDYTGAICSGNPVEVSPIYQAPQRVGVDYPMPNEVTAPAVDWITIGLRLNVVKTDVK